MRENYELTNEELDMPKKTFMPEQIIAKGRQIEVLLAQGKSTGIACKQVGISEQTYYR